MSHILNKIFGFAQEHINVVGRLEVLLYLGNYQTMWSQWIEWRDLYL